MCEKKDKDRANTMREQEQNQVWKQKSPSSLLLGQGFSALLVESLRFQLCTKAHDGHTCHSCVSCRAALGEGEDRRWQTLSWQKPEGSSRSGPNEGHGEKLSHMLLYHWEPRTSLYDMCSTEEESSSSNVWLSQT